MLVKCFSCGTMIEKGVGADIPERGRHRYYCSRCIGEATAKQDCMALCDEIFTYHVINTQLETNLKNLSETHSYSLLRAYIIDNKEKLSQDMCREFENERRKINYFTAIVKNHIADFVSSQDDCAKMDVVPEFYDVRYAPRKRKRSLSEFEGDMN